jgi:hypothetical protein
MNVENLRKTALRFLENLDLDFLATCRFFIARYPLRLRHQVHSGGLPFANP